MLVAIKKYWKDSHETEQSGSLGNGVNRARWRATGVGIRHYLMHYFLM